MKNLHLRRVYTEKGESLVKESRKLTDYLKEAGSILIGGSQGDLSPQLGRDWNNVISYKGCTIIYLRDYTPTIGLSREMCAEQDIMGFSLSVIGEENLVDKILEEIENSCPLLKDESISRKQYKTYGKEQKDNTSKL